MRTRRPWGVPCLVALFLAIPGLLGAEGSVDRTMLETSLRSTESAFAATMAHRDYADFASFIAEEAIFFDGDNALRGKDAVLAAWKPFFNGDAAPFSWEPQTAVVLATGDLGLTSGPVRNPAGEVIATFNSIWRHQSDGTWRIVFDRGCSH